MQHNRIINLIANKDSYSLHFQGMASPCEVIIQTTDKQLAQQLGDIVAKEVWRIEDKYSRYDPTSLCSKINQNAGQKVALDEETFQLLTFADQCYQLSDGLFDISSGVLRKAWTFNNTNHHPCTLPSQQQINALLCHVGWEKIHFDQQQVILIKGMEIDFGGIGKEYAVDRAIILAKQLTTMPVLVNLGGDLAVTGSRLNNEPWQVAIESPYISDNAINFTNTYHEKVDMIVALNSGALATSGDARRFILKDGIRYGHILDAKTGWPIVKAPRSITVVAPQCIQAGILATMALLQGANAETFLTDQDITYWSRR